MSEHRTQRNISSDPSALRMELVEKRTAHRKVFENQDHSYISIILR